MRMWSIAVATLLAIGTAFAQDEEAVVRAWAARRAEVRNVWAEVDVEFVHKKDTDPKSQNLLGRKDYTSKTKVTLVLDFENGRSRKEEVGEVFSVSAQANRPIDACQAYDGITLRTVGRPPAGEKTVVGREGGYVADYGEYTGDLTRSTYPNELMPVFHSCGLVPMRPFDRFWPGQFHTYDMAEWADVLSPSLHHPPGANSRWYSLPTNTHFTEYLVDTTPRRRVLEAAQGRKGQKANRTLKVRYGKVNSLEAPVGWECWEQLQFGGEAIHRCTLRKIAYNAPLNDGLFTCGPSEGMTAVRVRFPEADADPNASGTSTQKYFRVDEGLRLVEIESAGLGQSPDRKRSNGSFWWWVGGAGAVALVALAALLRWRGRR